MFSATSLANSNINSGTLDSLNSLKQQLLAATFYQQDQPPANTGKPAWADFIPSIRVPSIEFDSSKSFALNPNFSATPFEYTLSKTGGSPVSFSEIFTLENTSVSLCDKAYQNQANRLAAGSGSSLDLSTQIDGFVLGFLDMENDIKSSISAQITDTFSSLATLFSEEFIMHQTFKLFAKQQAKMMCNTCKVNLAGCNQIFLIAKSMSQVAGDSALKEKIASLAKQTGSHSQSGPIAELGVGSICTDIPILITPSGVGKSIQVSKYIEYSDKIALYEKSNRGSIMDGAMEQCLEWASNKSTKWMEKVISAATQKITLSVETQNSCLNEASDPLMVYEKNTKLREASERDLFSSINNSIGSFNDTATKFTDSLISNYNKPIKLLTRNPKPDVASIKEQLEETLELTETGDGSFLRINNIIESGMLDLYSKNIAASSRQVIRKLLKDAQLTSLLSPHYKKLGKAVFESIGVAAPDNDASYNSILPIYNNFTANIDFYANTIINDFLKQPNTAIPFLTCSNFSVSATNENICFNNLYKERLGINNPITTPLICDCVSYVNSIDLIRNPAILATALINQKKESISEVIHEDIVIKASDPTNLISTYKSSLDTLEMEFIEDLAVHLANIQANRMAELTKLPLPQVNSIRGLFYNILAEML